jgi:hypothetical protein
LASHRRRHRGLLRATRNSPWRTWKSLREIFW